MSTQQDHSVAKSRQPVQFGLSKLLQVVSVAAIWCAAGVVRGSVTLAVAYVVEACFSELVGESLTNVSASGEEGTWGDGGVAMEKAPVLVTPHVVDATTRRKRAVQRCRITAQQYVRQQQRHYVRAFALLGNDKDMMMI